MKYVNSSKVKVFLPHLDRIIEPGMEFEDASHIENDVMIRKGYLTLQGSEPKPVDPEPKKEEKEEPKKVDPKSAAKEEKKDEPKKEEKKDEPVKPNNTKSSK